MKTLLSREEFNTIVLKRDGYKCVLCSHQTDLAVHHILDRALFTDGGYYEDNGVTLCPKHHLEAENGIFSCEELRDAAKIETIFLPPKYDPTKKWDKWGEEIKGEEDIIKYPRTRHIQGSGMHGDDFDLEVVPIEELKNKNLVVEAKIDGANTGVSFSSECDLRLQCRGHFLGHGRDWPEFDQFKVWANTWHDQLFDVLTDRYIMYGEWMSAFHSVYYNNLPHLFLEFDIYDKTNGKFLSTEKRQEIMKNFPMKMESVKVIKTGKFSSVEEITSLICQDEFIVDGSTDELRKICEAKRIPEKDIAIFLKLNEPKLMEGLYIKWEEDGIVKGRYKYVRPNFVQTILSYGKHWLDRPSIPNRMKEGCSMFELK